LDFAIIKPQNPLLCFFLLLWLMDWCLSEWVFLFFPQGCWLNAKEVVHWKSIQHTTSKRWWRYDSVVDGIEGLWIEKSWMLFCFLFVFFFQWSCNACRIDSFFDSGVRGAMKRREMVREKDDDRDADDFQALVDKQGCLGLRGPVVRTLLLVLNSGISLAFSVHPLCWPISKASAWMLAWSLPSQACLLQLEWGC
jgi:hypothetical protein